MRRSLAKIRSEFWPSVGQGLARFGKIRCVIISKCTGSCSGDSGVFPGRSWRSRLTPRLRHGGGVTFCEEKRRPPVERRSSCIEFSPRLPIAKAWCQARRGVSGASRGSALPGAPWRLPRWPMAAPGRPEVRREETRKSVARSDAPRGEDRRHGLRRAVVPPIGVLCSVGPQLPGHDKTYAKHESERQCARCPFGSAEGGPSPWASRRRSEGCIEAACEEGCNCSRREHPLTRRVNPTAAPKCTAAGATQRRCMPGGRSTACPRHAGREAAAGGGSAGAGSAPPYSARQAWRQPQMAASAADMAGSPAATWGTARPAQLARRCAW